MVSIAYVSVNNKIHFQPPRNLIKNDTSMYILNQKIHHLHEFIRYYKVLLGNIMHRNLLGTCFTRVFSTNAGTPN